MVVEAARGLVDVENSGGLVELRRVEIRVDGRSELVVGFAPLPPLPIGQSFPDSSPRQTSLKAMLTPVSGQTPLKSNEYTPIWGPMVDASISTGILPSPSKTPFSEIFTV